MIAPGSRLEAICRATPSMAPTGVQRMTKSAPAAPSAALPCTRSARPSSATLSQTAGEESAAMISRASLLRRAARAIEEPMRPMPMSDRRSNKGDSSDGALERCGDVMVGFLGADRQPQAVRQAIGAHRAKDQAAAQEITVRIGRLGLAAKVQEQKIGGAWCHPDAEARDLLSKPREPGGIMGNCLRKVSGVFESRNARGHGGAVCIEWAADAIKHIGDASRRVAPPESQPSEPVNLRKRPRHNDVFAIVDKFSPGGIVGVDDIFGIG